jgi:uncharacterized protein
MEILALGKSSFPDPIKTGVLSLAAKRFMSKTLAVRICCLVVLFTFQGQLEASTATLPKRTGVVNDTAGVIDEATTSRITALSNALYAKTNSRVAVLTVQSLNGDDIRSYTNAIYQSWGIGKKGSDRGVLILLSVDDRRYRVEVGYGLESILPDGKIGGFGREAVPLFKKKQYGQALELIAARVAKVIADDSKIELSFEPEPVTSAQKQIPHAEKSHLDNLAIILICVGFSFSILLALVVFFILRNLSLNSTGWDSATDSSHSSQSFSDSGGFSDSGSSGGFDGGSSGGGEADGSF